MEPCARAGLAHFDEEHPLVFNQPECKGDRHGLDHRVGFGHHLLESLLEHGWPARISDATREMAPLDTLC
jgi:hypothetical protein